MPERRPSNSELRLRRLEAQEPDGEERGIFELFDAVDEEPADEDAALTRDPDDSAA